tara:strand:- start:3744 stop:5630 length:1887 start_codon:yes stop_codon:yes gene_type:complete
MQPRPLNTENRILRMTGADELRVTLGRAVSELSSMPMAGTLISRKMEQFRAKSDVFSEDEKLEILELEQLQSDLEYNLALEVDPIARESITSQLDSIYSQNKTVKDRFTEQALEEGRLKSPEDLNEQYKDLGLKFDAPTSQEEAKLLAKGKKEEIIRNAIISKSPTGLIPTVAKFGGGMLAVASDPLEVASMFIPFVGPAGRAASIAKLGRVAGRARVGAIEGVGGALLLEPLYYGLSKNQQLDYTMSEALLNVGAGLFLGGGIGTIAGMVARAPINPKAVLDAVGGDLESIIRTELDAVEIPVRLEVDQPAVAARAPEAKARTAAEQSNVRTAYMTAIRQFVTDQGIQVDMILTKGPRKPTTLSEFVKISGGINDQDPTFRGELKNIGYIAKAGYKTKKGTPVNPVSNTRSELNLDDMAELAEEAGYLPARDTNALMEALSEEARGNLVFARSDLEDAQDWRDYHDASSDLEAEISRRSDIRQELEEHGVKDVSDEEVAIVSQEMSRLNQSAAEAYGGLSRTIIDIQSEKLARNGNEIEGVSLDEIMANAPPNDSYFEDLLKFDSMGEDAELNYIIPRQEIMVEQIRADGGLTDYHLEQLAELEEIVSTTDAYVEVVEAASACVAGS